MLHYQWSTEVGQLRVAPAMAPSREPRMDCLAAWRPHCDSRNRKDNALPQKLARLGYTSELPGDVPAGRLREVLALAMPLASRSAQAPSDPAFPRRFWRSRPKASLLWHIARTHLSPTWAPLRCPTSHSTSVVKQGGSRKTLASVLTNRLATTFPSLPSSSNRLRFRSMAHHRFRPSIVMR
jgi:hypothetical protein